MRPTKFLLGLSSSLTERKQTNILESRFKDDSETKLKSTQNEGKRCHGKAIPTAMQKKQNGALCQAPNCSAVRELLPLHIIYVQEEKARNGGVARRLKGHVGANMINMYILGTLPSKKLETLYSLHYRNVCHLPNEMMVKMVIIGPARAAGKLYPSEKIFFLF